jgi:small subunit ribosomal protein S17
MLTFFQYFPSPKTYLVADPNSSLVEGDVVRINSGYRTGKQIRHVVTAIVAPFGKPASERPPVMDMQQLMDLRLRERLEKDMRAKQRGRLTSIWRLKEARKAGYQLPDLETAMKNVRIQEQVEEQKRSEEKGEKHSGDVGQAVTAKERRRAEREKTKGERAAEERVKRVKAQTVAS